MSWFRFWADLFKLFKNNQYQPYAREICWIIMPAHEDWSWQYYKDRSSANDNWICKADGGPPWCYQIGIPQCEYCSAVGHFNDEV